MQSDQRREAEEAELPEGPKLPSRPPVAIYVRHGSVLRSRYGFTGSRNVALGRRLLLGYGADSAMLQAGFHLATGPIIRAADAQPR